LGPGRLVVLPPVVTSRGGEVDVVTYGVAAWWSATFSRLGREALTIVHSAADDGSPLFYSAAPGDAEIRDTVLHPDVDGRFAIVAEYSKRPAEAVVVVRARLFEVRRGLPTRPLGDWTTQRQRDPDLDIAVATFDLFARVAARLGMQPEHRDWRDAFECPVPGPVVHILRVAGLCDLAARGLGLRSGGAGLRALVSALRTAPSMRPAIELFVRLFTLAAREPTIEDAALATAWQDAVDALYGKVPTAWRPIPELMRGRGSARSATGS